MAENYNEAIFLKRIVTYFSATWICLCHRVSFFVFQGLRELQLYNLMNSQGLSCTNSPCGSVDSGMIKHKFATKMLVSTFYTQVDC